MKRKKNQSFTLNYAHTLKIQFKKNLIFISQLILFSIAFLYREDVISSEMNLKKLVLYGLEKSPTIRTSKNNLEVSRFSVDNARAAFLPSLDFSATHGYQDGNPTSNTNPWAGELSLSLTESLYDNGTNLINYDISKLNQKKLNIIHKKDRDLFCLQVIKQYNAYSEALERLKAQQFQHKTLLKQFKSIESKYKRGEKTRTEYLRFKARLQRSSLSLKLAQNIVSKSLEEIKALIGFNEQNLSITPNQINKTNHTKNEPNKPLTIENHYEYKISNYEKLINDKTLRLAKKQYLPQVSLTAKATYSNSDYINDGQFNSENAQTDWLAIITVKYNLWDWGIKKRNFSIAKIETNTKNNAIDNQLLSLKKTLAKLTLDFHQQKENYKLNKELVELELKNYNSLEKDYRNGKSTFLDLVNSVDNLTNAQNLFIKNYFELKNSIAEYKFHQGKLYESIINN